MFRYMVILAFLAGMMGFSLVAFAGGTTCTSDNLECEVTVKCVCEYGGVGLQQMRVVACPTKDLPPGFESESDDPEGTLTADCRNNVEGLCEDLEIVCKKTERPNCLVTLPVEVGCGD